MKKMMLIIDKIRVELVFNLIIEFIFELVVNILSH